ncbi:MAG: IMP cyclohydrolase [Candidatus Nanoarchaeia archaeon]|nr:IMP cyclohydrolase [Candidatus Nanoarchaeia archaeon]
MNNKTDGKERGTDVADMKGRYRTAVEDKFPDEFNIELKKESGLRYGENPNQSAAIYSLKGTSLAELTDIRLAKTGKGGISATNMMDVTRALDILKFFNNRPSVAVMKHLIPCGFATQFNNNSLDNIYTLARDADARSAFGSVVVSTRPVDKATAEAIISTFVEGVAAPYFEKGVMDILETKKDLRVLLYSNIDKIPKFIGDDIKDLYDIKWLPTGRVIVQKPYLSSIRSVKDLILDPMVVKEDEKGTKIKYVVERDPTKREVNDLLTAWYINLGVRSNGIVFVKDGVSVAIGSGQQERVGAVEQAIIKAYQKAMDREKIEHYDSLHGILSKGRLETNPLEDAVCSSDGFFPFPDSISLMGREGVSAIIQPGGSINDDKIIRIANSHKMAMVYTLERCFAHF